MKKTDNQIFIEYEIKFICKVQHLSVLRAQNFTQSEMARWCGVSLRKIQHFEKYRCLSMLVVARKLTANVLQLTEVAACKNF